MSLLESAGKPTVVMATSEFRLLAREAARTNRLPEARIAVVQHPIGGTSEKSVRDRADQVVDEVIALFCGSAR